MDCPSFQGGRDCSESSEVKGSEDWPERGCLTDGICNGFGEHVDGWGERGGCCGRWDRRWVRTEAVHPSGFDGEPRSQIACISHWLCHLSALLLWSSHLPFQVSVPFICEVEAQWCSYPKIFWNINKIICATVSPVPSTEDALKKYLLLIM